MVAQNTLIFRKKDRSIMTNREFERKFEREFEREFSLLTKHGMKHVGNMRIPIENGRKASRYRGLYQAKSHVHREYAPNFVSQLQR